MNISILLVSVLGMSVQAEDLKDIVGDWMAMVSGHVENSKLVPHLELKWRNDHDN